MTGKNKRAKRAKKNPSEMDRAIYQLSLHGGAIQDLAEIIEKHVEKLLDDNQRFREALEKLKPECNRIAREVLEGEENG